MNTALFPLLTIGCDCSFVASRLAEGRKKKPPHEAPLAQIENENEKRLDVLRSIGPAYYYTFLWKSPEAVTINKI